MLSRDVFHISGMHLDGQDAVFCRRVCKTWKYYVDSGNDLTWKIKMHLVMLSDIKKLESTFARNTLKKLSSTEVNAWIESILWFNYRINVYDIYNIISKIYWASDLLESVIDYIFRQEEGYRGCFQNKKTNELIFTNNFYDTFAWNCVYYDDKFRKEFTSSCTDIDHYVKRIHDFNAVLPGFISNWKFIHFPFSDPKRHEILSNDYHRGSCVCITINPGKLLDAFSISKYLKKMIKAEPPLEDYVGRGKKKRIVHHKDIPGDSRICIFDKLKIVHADIKCNISKEEDAYSKEYKMKIYKTMPYDKELGKPSWE